MEKHDGTELEEMAEKYEQLKTQVEQYFDDDHGRARNKVPVVKAVEKPSKEEWLQHQATHTICTVVQALLSGTNGET